MKVVHALGWYFPESSAGTETYVDALIRGLREEGIESCAVAASDGEPADYIWNGTAVHRYAVPSATRAEFAGARPHDRFAEFEAWLRAQSAEIYHQHSWTRGCGLPHLALAKRLGLRTVLTIHVPSVPCLRGTMMLHGATPCDGAVEVARCTRCWGATRGIPYFVSAWQARFPRASGTVAVLLPDSRARTALRTPVLVARHRADLEAMGESADRVVVVCRWLAEAMARNPVPAHKTVYCAQGVDVPADAPERAARDEPSATLRVGFLGRWDAIKGVDVLVDAFRMLPADVPARLTVRALPGDRAYEARVKASASGDERVSFAPPVERDAVMGVLRDLDVLAVPSVCLETGPLVVLEALAAGTMILGSNLGGIAELLIDHPLGRLIPAGDLAAWSRAIAALAAMPRSSRLARSGRVVRSSRDVAREMAAVYATLLVDGTVGSAGDASSRAGH